MNSSTMLEKPLTAGAWQEELVFLDGQDYFDSLIADIDRAHYRVRLETYIFAFDALGRRIIAALGRAASRGVKVRVLMDGAGSSDGHHAARALEQHGIDVKIFHPLPWKTKHFRHALAQGPLLVKLFYFIREINQRDHRKLCIIDEQWLWSGSLNISATHLPRAAGGGGWRDYGIRVTGNHVATIAGHFDHLWERRPVKLGRGLFKFYLNNITDWARRHKNRLLINKIARAKQRIWITSAYFAPSNRVLHALKKARRRAVDIRLIVPRHSDISFFPLLTSTYYVDLLRAGIRVFEYIPGILHAKALLIDDFCLIGSTNFNHRSFLHDLELDLVLNTAHAKSTLEASFLTDMDASQEISYQTLNWFKRLSVIGWLPRLLRYWL